MDDRQVREFGMARGQVFPADEARSLLNPLRRLVQSPRRTVAAIELAATAAVLEVGPGPGFFTPYLVDAVPRGAVALLDLQLGMLTLARQRLAGRSTVRYVQGDASALPFTTGSFDAVFVATMLGEVPDTDACVGELRRVVAPTGTLAVAETRRDSDFVAFSRLRVLFARHRFELVTRRGMSWQYVALFRPV